MMLYHAPARAHTGYVPNVRKKGNPRGKPRGIATLIKKLQQGLADKNLHNIKAVILYGSWIKRTAREDSDVDFLAVYRRRDKKTVEAVNELANKIGSDREFTFVHASLKDFIKEKWPVYTAVKKDGRIIYGDVCMTVSKMQPLLKYSEFFKKSCECESHKVELAKKLLSDGLSSGVVEYCFIAAKHAIQAALAMRGEGYSSKMDILIPLAKERLGKKIYLKFLKLFEIYKKSEKFYNDISKKDAKLAVQCAREVLKVYDKGSSFEYKMYD